MCLRDNDRKRSFEVHESIHSDKAQWGVRL
jgi:hypothetical protein